MSLKNEMLNLQQKPLFYASYANGSRQLIWATVTVEMVS
jgi:hypothetical protein